MSWVLLEALLSSPIVQAIGAALVAFGAAVWYGRSKKKEGASEAEVKAAQKDIENAEDIRTRIERDLADELRKHEGRGYRD